mmetsp:Transcript_26478/g.69604  ORF Transcript_26478/g.69604 Transcript_26478/m.69604 type:complete len:235 (-) Transcript_26478:357-1061(-)
MVTCCGARRHACDPGSAFCEGDRLLCWMPNLQAPKDRRSGPPESRYRDSNDDRSGALEELTNVICVRTVIILIHWKVESHHESNCSSQTCEPDNMRLIHGQFNARRGPVHNPCEWVHVNGATDETSDEGPQDHRRGEISLQRKNSDSKKQEHVHLAKGGDELDQREENLPGHHREVVVCIVAHGDSCKQNCHDTAEICCVPRQVRHIGHHQHDRNLRRVENKMLVRFGTCRSQP